MTPAPEALVRLSGSGDRSSRVSIVAVMGLLVAIIVIGVVGIAINQNIHGTVERAIAYDVELEDRGDDLRVAILEVRHYHRDLLLNNPDATRIALWRERYEVLLDEIEALDELLERHPDRDELPSADELHEVATAYYAGFAAAVEDGVESEAEFRVVAEDLLVPIDRLARTAELVDQAGEERAEASFRAIDEASTTGTLVLVGVIAGLGAIGAMLGFVMLRVVRDQRRIVAAEQAASAQMAAVAQAKSDFIADASHELRTPLTVLRGNAEIGLTLEDAGGHREIFEEIVNEASRMSRLVDDLLFLARSDSSNVPLELRHLDIEQASHDLVARAEVLARERGVELVTDLRARGTIRADATRIDQALLILVDNAAKYGSAGGTIEIATHLSDDRLVVEVRDRGPGIPPEEASRVFERFYRTAGASRSRARGAGLGLAIAAAIVAGHGGRIAVVPRPGGGTVMRITLPLRTPVS